MQQPSRPAQRAVTAELQLSISAIYSALSASADGPDLTHELISQLLQLVDAEIFAFSAEDQHRHLERLLQLGADAKRQQPLGFVWAAATSNLKLFTEYLLSRSWDVSTYQLVLAAIIRADSVNNFQVFESHVPLSAALIEDTLRYCFETHLETDLTKSRICGQLQRRHPRFKRVLQQLIVAYQPAWADTDSLSPTRF